MIKLLAILINVHATYRVKYAHCKKPSSRVMQSCDYFKVAATSSVVIFILERLILKSGLKHSTYSVVMHSLCTQDTKSPSLPTIPLSFMAPKHL